MRELKNDLSLKHIVVKLTELTELTESGNRGFLRTQKKPKAEHSISEHPIREAKNPSAK